MKRIFSFLSTSVSDTGFVDVDVGSWYAEAVKYCRDNYFFIMSWVARNKALSRASLDGKTDRLLLIRWYWLFVVYKALLMVSKYLKIGHIISQFFIITE